MRYLNSVFIPFSFRFYYFLFRVFSERKRNKLGIKKESRKLLYCTYPLDSATKRSLIANPRWVRENEVGSVRKLTSPHFKKRVYSLFKLTILTLETEYSQFPNSLNSVSKLTYVNSSK